MSGAPWRDSPILLSGGSVSGASTFHSRRSKASRNAMAGLRDPSLTYRAATATLSMAAESVLFP